MPEANPAPILSNPPSRYPRIAPVSAQEPKLLDRLCEALRSRHYSRSEHYNDLYACAESRRTRNSQPS